MVADTIKRILIATAVFLVAVAVAYISGLGRGRKGVISPDPLPPDTLVVYKTITRTEPVYQDRVVIKEVQVPVPVHDTLWIRDTMYVLLPREKVVWEDEFSRVFASGIQAQVDSVQHLIQERVITREIKVKTPCRWSVGLQAGYGIQFGDRIQGAPYLGIGVSYNLLSW